MPNFWGVLTWRAAATDWLHGHIPLCVERAVAAPHETHTDSLLFGVIGLRTGGERRKEARCLKAQQRASWTECGTPRQSGERAPDAYGLGLITWQ